MDATLILIDTDTELARARVLVGRLWKSDRPADIARLQAQARLIAAYEESKWPRQPPSTGNLIRHLMDQHGLSRADMVPILGTPSRVAKSSRAEHGNGAEVTRPFPCSGRPAPSATEERGGLPFDQASRCLIRGIVNSCSFSSRGYTPLPPDIAAALNYVPKGTMKLVHILSDLFSQLLVLRAGPRKLHRTISGVSA